MWGHYSARGQIGTVPVRAALAGPAWVLHSIVGWALPIVWQQREEIIQIQIQIQILDVSGFGFSDECIVCMIWWYQLYLSRTASRH